MKKYFFASKTLEGVFRDLYLQKHVINSRKFFRGAYPLKMSSIIMGVLDLGYKLTNIMLNCTQRAILSPNDAIWSHTYFGPHNFIKIFQKLKSTEFYKFHIPNFTSRNSTNIHVALILQYCFIYYV